MSINVDLQKFDKKIFKCLNDGMNRRVFIDTFGMPETQQLNDAIVRYILSMAMLHGNKVASIIAPDTDAVKHYRKCISGLLDSMHVSVDGCSSYGARFRMSNGTTLVYDAVHVAGRTKSCVQGYGIDYLAMPGLTCASAKYRDEFFKSYFPCLCARNSLVIITYDRAKDAEFDKAMSASGAWKCIRYSKV